MEHDATGLKGDSEEGRNGIRQSIMDRHRAVRRQLCDDRAVRPAHPTDNIMMRRLIVSLFTGTLLFTVGGGAIFAQGTTTGDPAATAKPAAQPATEDRTLTPAEAETLKFPSLDRPWKGADYEQVTQILSRIGTVDAPQLPRYGSARSGELFAKLTTTAHFNSFNDPAVDVKTRVPEALQQLQSLNRLGVIYQSAADRKFVGVGNYLTIYVTMSEAARRVLIALDEYVGTLDEKDPNAPFRKEGILKLKEAIADMISTAVLTLGDEKLSEQDRRTLAQSLEASVPAAMVRLPESRRHSLLLRLRFFANNTEPKELQPVLRQFVEAIDKAIAAGVPQPTTPTPATP